MGSRLDVISRSSMHQTELYDVLERAADRAVETQRSDGSMPPGHNGPYRDPETPVRNTSHWLVTFLHVYATTGDDRYLDAATEALEYLLGPDARPAAATFYHRKEPEKNSCNGLVGQAWTIEALAAAAEALDDPEPAEVARDVFLMHPFDDALGLWKCVEVDGTVLPFDGTFNHQLWFAAAGSLLSRSARETPEVDRRVQRFVDTVPKNVGLYPDGLIAQGLEIEQSIGRLVRLLRSDERGRLFFLMALGRSGLTEVEFLRDVVNHPAFPVRRAPLRPSEVREKAIGYHSFNMYAFALLKAHDPTHRFWSSETFDAALSYLRSDAYPGALEGNEYGYPYNPPGFEVPYALEVFDEEPSRTEQEWWASRQLTLCYDAETSRMERHTEDPTTLTARLYQATRLPNLRVRLPQVAP
jgi:hypothetical protein